MLLIALQNIPGTISIAPGQQFYEPNDEQRAMLIRTKFARPADASEPIETIVKADLNAKSHDDVELQLINGVPDWRGATVVIIASGPSLTEDQCLHVEMWRKTPNVERRIVIAINTSWQRAKFADMLYACDGAWWFARESEATATNYERASEHFAKSQLWTQDAKAAEELGIKLIRSQAKDGLSRRHGLIHQGASGTYQAINIGFLAGAKHFVLLGVDCKGGHWHGNHPSPLSNSLPHKLWMAKLTALADDLRAEGVSVMNCSPGTALRAFPTGDLERELPL